MAPEPGAQPSDPDTSEAPGALRDPVELARSEGTSAGILRSLELAERRFPPRVVRGAGFWVAVYGRFARHRGPVLAGGLAFFGMLSLVPALLSLAAVAAFVIDPATISEAAERLLVDHPEAADMLRPVVDMAVEAAGAGAGAISLTVLISIGVSLYAASRFIYVGQQVLEIAFDTHPKPPSLIKRVGAIAVTLMLQLGLVLGLLVLGILPRILGFLGIAQLYEDALRVLRQPLLVAAVYLLLTAAMRYSSRARREVPWLNPGAAAGTLIVLIGTLGLQTFLGFSQTYSQIIGVMGGVVALELWLYVIGIAIVISAETEGIRTRLRREDLAGADPTGPSVITGASGVAGTAEGAEAARSQAAGGDPWAARGPEDVEGPKRKGPQPEGPQAR